MKTDHLLPSFSTLRCFEIAAKHESFTAAAEELGLTQGAVSRQVKELEAQIGAPLFAREGRGSRLTDAGRRLAEDLGSDLDRLRETIRQAVAAGAEKRTLSLAAPPTFCTRWLVPRLRDFRDTYDLELLVQSRSDPFDLVAAKVDLAIHFGGWDWPGAQLAPLCPENLLVVAAPELIADQDCPVAELASALPLLHLTSRPYLWDYCEPSAHSHLRRSGCYFDQFSLVIAAAIAGMGLAVIPSYLIEAELADGRLIALERLPDDQSKQYFVARPAGGQTDLTDMFINWIRKQVTRRAWDA